MLSVYTEYSDIHHFFITRITALPVMSNMIGDTISTKAFQSLLYCKVCSCGHPSLFLIFF